MFSICLSWSAEIFFAMPADYKKPGGGGGGERALCMSFSHIVATTRSPAKVYPNFSIPMKLVDDLFSLMVFA